MKTQIICAERRLLAQACDVEAELNGVRSRHPERTRQFQSL